MASELKIIISASDKASGAIKGVQSAVQGLGSAAGTIAGVAKTAAGAIVALGGAAAGLGAAAAKLAIDAAPLVDVEAAFYRLAEAAGVAGPAILKAMQDASQGMISMTDLMKAFNNAAMLVGDVLSTRLPEALEVLGRVARATGEDMNYLLNSLVTGIGRLSPLILDNLKITMDAEKAYKDWADAMDRTVQSMTKAEKQAALLDYVLDQLNKKLVTLGDSSVTAAVRWAQLKAQWEDTKYLIGKALVPALAKLLGIIQDFADRNLPKAIAAVEKFGLALDLFIGRVQAGQDPLEAFQTIVKTLFPEAAPAVGKIVGAIEDITAAISALEEGDISGFLEIMGMEAPDAQAVEDYALAIYNLGDAIVEAFGPETQAAWDTFWQGILEDIQAGPKEGSLLDQIFGSLEPSPENIDAAAESWREYGDAIMAAIIEGFGETDFDIYTALGLDAIDWQAVGAAISEGLNSASAAISEWLNETAAGLDWGLLFAGLFGTIAQIAGAFASLPATIGGVTGAAGAASAALAGAIIGGIAGLAGEVINAVSTALSGALEAAGEFLGQALAIGMGLVMSIAAGAAAMAGMVLTAVTSAITSAITGGKTDAEGASAIGQTLGEGIAAIPWDAVGVVKAIVAAAFAAGWAAAQGGSPSKLMMKLGESLAEGLAVGIDENASLPITAMADTTTATIGAAAATIPAMRGGYGGGYPAARLGGNFTLVYSPGISFADGEEVKTQIAPLIEEVMFEENLKA